MAIIIKLLHIYIFLSMEISIDKTVTPPTHPYPPGTRNKGVKDSNKQIYNKRIAFYFEIIYIYM